MKTLQNFLVKEKNVLLRVDLNISVKDGNIIDNTKLFEIKSTVDELRAKQNKIFLLSHFGRPKGEYNKKYSIEFLTKILSEILLTNKIFFVHSCSGEEINNTKNTMNPGDICLLENIRFYEGEEKNDINFSKLLAKNFDIYINDAFSVSHRNHASIVGVSGYLPSLAGFNLVNEIKYLNQFLSNLKKPATAIIGGSKISTKLKLLDNLVEIFDTIVIGGAMANTFLLSKGFSIGASLIEEDLVVDANNILEKSNSYKTKLILPVDLVCAKKITDTTNIKCLEINNLPSDFMALDIGGQTIKLIKSVMLESKMILWNGPLGAFEYTPFNYGTNEIVTIIKNEIQKLNIITLAGGGDTVAAIKKAKAEKYFTYLSTAGGAFLEWLEGKESPGVRALRENNIF